MKNYLTTGQKILIAFFFIIFSFSLILLIKRCGGGKGLCSLLYLLQPFFPGIFAIVYSKAIKRNFPLKILLPPDAKLLLLLYLIFALIPVLTIITGHITGIHKITFHIPLLTKELKDYLNSHHISENTLIYTAISGGFIFFPFLLLFITIPLEIGWRWFFLERGYNKKDIYLFSLLWAFYFLPDPILFFKGFLLHKVFIAGVTTVAYFILGVFLSIIYTRTGSIFSSAFSLSTFFSVSQVLPIFCKNYNAYKGGATGKVGVVVFIIFFAVFYLIERKKTLK